MSYKKFFLWAYIYLVFQNTPQFLKIIAPIVDFLYSFQNPMGPPAFAAAKITNIGISVIKMGCTGWYCGWDVRFSQCYWHIYMADSVTLWWVLVLQIFVYVPIIIFLVVPPTPFNNIRTNLFLFLFTCISVIICKNSFSNTRVLYPHWFILIVYDNKSLKLDMSYGKWSSSPLTTIKIFSGFWTFNHSIHTLHSDVIFTFFFAYSTTVLKTPSMIK